MGFHRGARRALAAPALGLVLAAAIAACSSSPDSSSSHPPATSATATTAAPASGSAAVAAITSAWNKFFNGSTPTAQRVSLLQNGQAFASTIKGMSSLGSSASVKVTNVTVNSPAQATVTYTIYLGGTPALPNAQGQAVVENGAWKVSDASFCDLLTLQNAGKAPSVCSTAG